MERGSLNAQKHTSGEAPKVCSVFGVQYYLFALAWSQPAASRPSQSPQRDAARSLAPVAARARRSRSWYGARRSSRPTRCAGPQPVRSSHAVLVNTSVYLKPTKLLNVALDVLARLAPCLNLGVRELGHKDLLDTISADNRRK